MAPRPPILGLGMAPIAFLRKIGSSLKKLKGSFRLDAESVVDLCFCENKTKPELSGTKS